MKAEHVAAFDDATASTCLEDASSGGAGPSAGENLLYSLLRSPPQEETPPAVAMVYGVLVGELVAFVDDAQFPLVTYHGQQGTAAVAARSSVPLHAAHVGRPVVLVFERGDPMRPIVVGVLQGRASPALEERPGSVEVDADGRRLTVSAEEKLVLRCGAARITLTRAGKVLIEGSYVLSRSSGVNRIKGGSVQLN